MLAAPPFGSAQADDPNLDGLLFEAVILPDTGVAARPPALREPGDRDLADRDYFREINDYEEAVAELELEHGPYSSTLAEQLEALASLYEAVGSHAQAIATYEKAMHIQRVNQGLYTLAQTGMVRDLIRNHEALRNFDEVDDLQEYLYLVAQKNYPDETREMLQAKASWADWNVKAYYRRLDEMQNSPVRISSTNTNFPSTDYVAVRGPNNTVTFVPRNQVFGASAALTNSYLRSGMSSGLGSQFLIDPRLRTAQDLYEEISEAVSADETLDATDPARVDAEKKLANISYIVKQQQDIMDSRLTSANLFSNRVFQPQGDHPLISRGYVNGRDALAEVLQDLRDDPQAGPADIAMAQLDLADWHLSYERPQRAFANYREAYQGLIEAGYETEQVESAFSPGALVQIPTYATHRYSRRMLGLAADAPVDWQGFIDLELTVDRYGKIRRANVLGTSPDTPYRVRRALLDHVRITHVRPHLEAGEAVEQEGLKLRYYYSH